jgi:GTP:adenosylcobinamide-phosphate guanylyltransferase
MDAIVIAGGDTRPGEPLYPFTAGTIKSLLDICGKPMVQWVLDALDGAKLVEQIVVVGIQPQADLHSTRLAGYLPDHGSILENIRAGVIKIQEINPAADYVVVVSSDIPAILPEQVDWVIESAMQNGVDFYYNIIKREVMEKRFPGSNRSYVTLRDMDVCGGDLNIIRARAVEENDELWEKIVNARKNALKQAALIGYGTLILLLLRRLTLQSAVKRVTRRIHLSGRALVCPYAEIGMDVDKPHQLEIIRTDLCQRTQP